MNNLELTNIFIDKIEDNTKVKAVVTIVINKTLQINNIFIIQGKKELFVSFPSKRLPDGTYKNIISSTSKEFYNYVSSAVLGNYLRGDL